MIKKLAASSILLLSVHVSGFAGDQGTSTTEPPRAMQSIPGAQGSNPTDPPAGTMNAFETILFELLQCSSEVTQADDN